MRSMLPAAFVSLFLLTLPAAASGGELRMEFRDGYVSIKAADVPLRQVLTEWARLGHTRVVNGEKLGGLLTLELTNVPEKQALDIILRTVPGYLAAQRTTAVPGGSQFDRIVVMPGTVAPPTHSVASAPPPPPPMPPPAPAMVEDQDQPIQEPPERADQAEQPEQPEQAESTEQDQQPQPIPQTLPQPGFQPVPPNPPGPNNSGTAQQPAGPVPTPGHGAIVSPTPGHLPAPPPPKPQDQQDQQQQQQQDQ
jgi:hypothetical protein